MTQPEVFTRKTSGLVRVMSPNAAFVYNVLTMGLIFPWTYLWGPWAFPGSSLALGILIATAIQVFICGTYVYLAAAMPRSGGDYVFQSRVLGGGIGYTVVMSGFVIWILQWVALSGWLFAVLGVAPLFQALGVHFQNQGMIGLGNWALSPSGIVVISLVLAVITTLVLLRGLKLYVLIQQFMFVATLIAVALILWLFFTTPSSAFVERLNSFGAGLGQGNDFYHFIINDVKAAGWDTQKSFSLLATLGIAPIAWTSLQWATYSVEQGSEIQGAESRRNQAYILIGSCIFTGLLLALLAVAEEKAIGSEFLSAVSASYYGQIKAEGSAGMGSIAPFPNILAMAITASPVVICLIALGYLANAWQVTFNCFIGMTRNMVAMALDRTLPEWVARVHPRLHSPVNAHVAYLVGSVVWILAYNYVPGWTGYTLGVTFACGYVFVLSTLAGALMPYRAKELYQASGATEKLGRVPLVTVLGGVGTLLGGAMVLSFMFVPALGLTGMKPYTIVFGIILISSVMYLIAKSVNRSRGIDISLAFKAVPPQ
ncbi:MAG: amino acid permease [Gemmatimonadales bacterium]